MNANTIQSACLTYISILSLSPAFNLGPFSRELGAVCVLLWLTMELARPQGIFQPPSRFTVAAIAFLLFGILSTFAVSGLAGVNRHLQLFIASFFVLPAQAVARNPTSSRTAFWGTIIAAIYWQTTTVLELNVDAHAARTVSRNSEEATELVRKGVGGYALVYFSVFLFPSLIGLIRYSGKPASILVPFPLRIHAVLPKALLFVSAGVSIALILKAGYALAVISLLAFIFARLFQPLTRSPTYFFVSMCLALAVLLLATQAITPILKQVKPLVKGTKYENKLDDIIDTVDTGRAVSTVEARLTKYRASLNDFLASPIFGTLRQTGTGGGHSAYLDSLANWGLLGGLPLLFFSIGFPLSLGTDVRSNTIAIPLTVIAAIVFTAGTISACHGASIFLFSAYALSAINHRTNYTADALPQAQASGNHNFRATYYTVQQRGITRK